VSNAPLDAPELLGDLALGQLITSKLHQSLREAPGTTILVQAPSDSWADALRHAITENYPDIACRCYRLGKRKGPAEDEDSLVLAQREGRAVIAVSTDVEGYVPSPLRLAADATLRFEGLTLRSPRKAIILVTGMRVTGLRAADAGLDYPELCAALRQGSRPSQCLARLRLAASRQALALTPDETVPPVSELPLSEAVQTWSKELLVNLGQLERGQLSMRNAPFTLLAGPPGTGKTLLAQAIAKEAGWRFVSTSVKEWFERSDGYLGGVSKMAAEFFRLLEENDRTIGFIDELDVLPDRNTVDSQNREWWNSIVSAILLNIDKLRRSKRKVLLLAATNYPKRIDAALLRHGRVGHTVLVHPPRSRAEIGAVFRFYLGNALTAVQLNRLVEIAFALGLPTPATIGGWVGTARARASAGNREVTLADVERAITGDEARSAAELYRVAVHEAGHAVIAVHLGVPVSAVSVIKNGGSGGSMVSDVDTACMDRQTVEDLVTVALAGRAADLELLGRSDAGASSDLALATRLLFDARFRSGLFDQLLTFELDVTRLHELDHSTRAVLEKRLQTLMQRARDLVLEKRAVIEALANLLVERRVVEGGEVQRLLSDGQPLGIVGHLGERAP
jgi:cell division protease FtsH